MHRLPRAARVAIAVYLAFIAITGTAEGAYHLTHAYKPSPGLRFAPEMIGLRTQPPPRYEPLRASGRAVGRSVVIREPQVDFWRALANCESADGRSTRSFIGYFQFQRGGTADTVGIDGSESYEEQRAAAQGWASRVSNPGSTAGWPHCWWVAKRAVGYAP